MIGNIAKEAKWISLQLLQSFATYLCNNCANYKHRTMLLDITNFSYHHLQIVILIDSVSDIYHFSHISYLIITKILFEDHRIMIYKSLNRSENEPQKAFFSILRVIILSIWLFFSFALARSNFEAIKMTNSSWNSALFRCF